MYRGLSQEGKQEVQGHVGLRRSVRRGKREAVRLLGVVWQSTKELPGQATGFNFAFRTAK